MDIACLTTAIFRRFRAWVLRRDVEIIGQCKLCGDCCHDILLSDKNRWLKTDKQYKALCETDPRYKRFVNTGKNEFGQMIFSCSKQENNICTCYEDRMAICRQHPSKSLYYQGGWLRRECGYSFKTTTFRDVFMRRKRARMPKFEDVLKQEKEKV